MLEIPAGGELTIPFRLRQTGTQPCTDCETHGESLTNGSVAGRCARRSAPSSTQTFADRIRETDEFYATKTTADLSDDERLVSRQAYAGMLWSRQFYHYVINDWLDGDPGQPKPPADRAGGRNSDWRHIFNRDVVTTPDKWEYPGLFLLGHGLSPGGPGPARSRIRQASDSSC